MAAAVVALHNMVAFAAFDALVVGCLPFLLSSVERNLRFGTILSLLLFGSCLIVPCLQVSLKFLEIRIFQARSDVSPALRLRPIGLVV